MTEKGKPHQFSYIAEKLIGDFRQIPYDASARMKKRPTKDIHELIDGILDKYQIGRESPQRTLLEHWTEIAGSANAVYSHPREITTRGVLVIATSHPVVRNELFHNRSMLLDRIKKLPGCSIVRSIRVASS